jgi:hypothetical protein
MTQGISLTKWQHALAADTSISLATKGFLLVATIHCNWETGTGVKLGPWLQRDRGISRTQAYEHIKTSVGAGYLTKDARNLYHLSVPDAMSVRFPGQSEDAREGESVRNPEHLRPESRTSEAESVRDTGLYSHQSSLISSHHSEPKEARKGRQGKASSGESLATARLPGSQDSGHSYIYWEKDDSWFVFPAAQVKHRSKDAVTVTLSVEEDEFYREFFHGGKELNRARAEFLTGSPEERARNIEYIRDHPGLHPMTDDEYSRAA